MIMITGGTSAIQIDCRRKSLGNIDRKKDIAGKDSAYQHRD